MLKKILFALMFAIVATVTHADPIGISEGGGTPDPGVQYGITDPEADEVVEEEDNGMKIAASKAYVDTMVETRQDKIPAANQQGVGAGETVMTYTAAGNGAIGERGIYTGANAYNANSDADKLITASALNDTFTNLPTTGTTKLECANLNDGCTLWTIVDQTAYGKSRNLFNKNGNDTAKGFVSGRYLGDTGNLISFGQTNVSEYIPVLPNTEYYLTSRTIVGSAHICWYDVNKEFLSCAFASTGEKTSPLDAVFCRISYWDADKDVVQFELGSTATPYEPY